MGLPDNLNRVRIAITSVMSDLVIRPMEPADAEGFYRVYSLTYGDGTEIPVESQTSRYADRFVAVQNGEVVGIFHLLQMATSRGRATIPTFGVAGVAVAPFARRGGVGLAMMNWAVDYARTSGYPLCSLYAFRETFYAKSGYQVVGKRIRLQVPSHRLPGLPSSFEARRLQPSDWKLLLPAYEAFAHQRSGLNLRSEEMWNRVLNENRPLTIVAFGDPVEAYVAYWPSGAFWVDYSISEFVWSSARGYEAALGYLRQLGINKASMSWYEPSDSPFYTRYMDAQVEARIDRPIMFRVCDVPGAISRLSADGTGTFTIGILDDVISENRGPWLVAFESDSVQVELLASEDQADFELPIDLFAAALLGEPSLSDLVRNGLVTVHNERGLQAALHLLPPLPTTCYDFF